MTNAESYKRLYKSRQNRILTGVCGGIGEYAHLDPTLVRIIWVILALVGGLGVILYIAAAILMPAAQSEASGRPSSPNEGTPSPKSSRSGGEILGALLIGVGLFLLLDNLDVLPGFRWLNWWGDLIWRLVAPLILILLGIFLISWHLRGKRRSAATSSSQYDASSRPVGKVLRRSRTDRKIFGVCGGISEYFSIDPTITRMLFVLFAFGSFGIALLVYIILAIAMPEEQLKSTPA